MQYMQTLRTVPSTALVVRTCQLNACTSEYLGCVYLLMFWVVRYHVDFMHSATRYVHWACEGVLSRHCCGVNEPQG